MKKYFLITVILAIVACGKSNSAEEVGSQTGQETPIAPNNPNTPAPISGQLTREVLRIPYQNAGRTINIYGEILAPQGYQQQKLPLVILSPGFGNNMEFISRQYAESIARLGFITYSLEFYGGNIGSRSGGQMTEMSPFTEVEDLTAVLNTLRERSFVDENNIFLLGFSQGGVVSAITATENPEKVKGLVLMNAAFVLFDDAKREFASVADIPEIVNFRGNRLGKIYFERSLSYDIYQHLPRYDKEVLIIQGTRDEVVPLRYAQRAATTFPKATLREIQGAGHVFNSTQNNALFPFISEYLNRTKN